MGKTSISWTDYTVQVTHGCSIVSPGCASCYAMRLAGTRLRHMDAYAGLTMPSPNGPVWNGTMRPAAKSYLMRPLHWRQPSRIFVNSLSDLFAEAVLDPWIDRALAMAGLAHWHQFLILTKRPDRALRYMTTPGRRDYIVTAARELVSASKPANLASQLPPLPFPNVVIGASVEDRARLPRIDALREIPASARFLSLEPLLEPLGRLDLSGIDLVIVGGESKTGGREARALPNISEIRNIRDQCADAGVAFHFKQVGSNHAGWPSEVTGKGDDPEEWPLDLRNQQRLPARAA